MRKHNKKYKYNYKYLVAPHLCDDFSREIIFLDLRIKYDTDMEKKRSKNKNRKKNDSHYKKERMIKTRGANPYIFFAKEELIKLKEEMPKSRNADRFKVISDRWKRLSNEQKKHYTDLSQKDKLYYNNKILS